MKKVLLYGLDQDSTQKLQSIFEGLDTKVHFLKNEDLHKTLIEVLEAAEEDLYEAPNYKMTVCIFAGYDKDGIYAAIDRIKEAGLPRPVFATVTQNNINWKIGALVTDVNQEHMEMMRLAQEKAQEGNKQ